MSEGTIRTAIACENCRRTKRRCGPPYPCAECTKAKLDCVVRDKARPRRSARRTSQDDGNSSPHHELNRPLSSNASSPQAGSISSRTFRPDRSTQSPDHDPYEVVRKLVMNEARNVEGMTATESIDVTVDVAQLWRIFVILPNLSRNPPGYGIGRPTIPCLVFNLHQSYLRLDCLT